MPSDNDINTQVTGLHILLLYQDNY